MNKQNFHKINPTKIFIEIKPLSKIICWVHLEELPVLKRL